MKANELMVGDWVRVKAPYFKKNKAYRVVEVREHGYNGEATANIELPDEDEEASMTGEYIIGIPITPEILEKNGFIYNDLPFVQGWEQFGLTLFPGGNGFRITCGQNVAMVIDSVHELQHALRLCGIEKNIEL